MKSTLQTLIACVVLTLLQVEVYGQRTTIYHENFSGTVTNLASNWQNGVLPLATGGYPLKASRGEYIQTGSTAGTYTLTLGEFSAGGYEDITVSWIAKKTGTPAIKLEYRFNGGEYVPAEKLMDVNPNQLDVVTVPLKECFNKGRVELRWTYNSEGNSTYALDDITVTGVPFGGEPSAIFNSSSAITSLPPTSVFEWSSREVGEDPFSFAGLNNTKNSFYEADGVKMQWSNYLSPGIDMWRHHVTKDFQAKESFAIVQNYYRGVGAENYTRSTLSLSAPVQGLSFTINDVDETPRINRDIVKIIAYRADGTTVLPKKEHAQVTTYNEFVVAGSEYLFRSKTDPTDTNPWDGNNINEVNDNNPEGDITVTFLEAVAKVDIIFSNGVSNGQSSGQQNIGISDISWRNASLPAINPDMTTKSAIPTPLPVTMVSFEVKKMVNGAKLEWSTASEINNDRFVVERSVDGKTFEAIGEVKGTGNSATLVKYSFLDNAPKAGINYYRLTQHDYDGKSETSKTIYLTYSGATAAVALSTYPNPATEDLTIKPTTSATVDQTYYILNAAGNLVKTVILPKNQTSVQVSVRELASGLYLVKSDKAVSRFFKQ